MEIDEDGMTGQHGVATFSARDALGGVLSGCVPPALDRHLAHIRRVSPSVIDNAGLPSEPPPRTWRLDVSLIHLYSASYLRC
jgi:hypothetical protein